LNAGSDDEGESEEHDKKEEKDWDTIYA
jgi:hypothetical protein